MSSDSEYHPPGDSIEVWNRTSKWRPIQLEKLKVEFQDGDLRDIVENTDLSTVNFGPFIDRILLPDIDINSSKDVSENQLPFFNRLKQLKTFSDEPPIDSITHDLLTYTGFEGRILHFRPRPRLRIMWRDHDIASEADYGVYSNRSCRLQYLEYLLIVEDKPEKRWIYQIGECQLYGEMLLSAVIRYQDLKDDQIVYGIIIRGPLVRFYKTIFSRKYLSEISKDKIPSSRICPKIYPKEG